MAKPERQPRASEKPAKPGTPAPEEAAAPGRSARSSDGRPPGAEREKKHPKKSESAMPTGMLGRAGRLAAASLKSSLRVAFAGPRLLLGRDAGSRLLELHAGAAQDLLATLGRLKGASMKVGQLASFIDAGVLPEEVRDTYQQVLGSLRDAAPPMKPKLVKEVFKAEFDAEPEELFASFETKPVAAASLGQVHLASLDDGREVAVKIQYPGIEAAVRSDMAMTAAVKPLVPLLAPGLDVHEALEEMRTRVLEECDYILEAESLDTLARHYEGHPFVYVPSSVPERTTRRILTMERTQGATFSQIKRLPKAERDRVGEILFRFYYGSLHRYGFTSADPHPGNYMLMEDGRMAFFDFGLACNLDPRMSPHMLGGLIALRDHDVDKLFEHGLAMRYVTRAHTDPQRFFDWVAFSLDPIRADRDYTFKRQFIADRTAAMLDPRNPWWSFIRQLNLPRWAVLIYRLELGLFAVLAQLGATANWHRITMGFYGDAPPAGELGQAEWQWLRDRTRPEDGPAAGTP
ncbi:MAG: ABC1 kinase family protein [Actinomycetota bacterium]